MGLKAEENQSESKAHMQMWARWPSEQETDGSRQHMPRTLKHLQREKAHLRTKPSVEKLIKYLEHREFLLETRLQFPFFALITSPSVWQIRLLGWQVDFSKIQGSAHKRNAKRHRRLPFASI